MSLYIDKKPVGVVMKVWNPTAEENDVIFIDYDGTIRYSYSTDEFLALTELPPNPIHAGLTAQGWNWTLLGAQAYVRKYGICSVGQNYNTYDGKTRFVVRISDELNLKTYLYFYQSKSNGVSINWGDGTAAETISGTGNKEISHTWPSTGTYEIVFTIDSDCTVKLGGSDHCMFVPSSDNGNRYYASQLTSAQIGERVNGFVRDTFYNCRAFQSISIPQSLTDFDKIQLFRANATLKAVVFPPNVKFNNANFIFEDAYSMEYPVLPEVCAHHVLPSHFAPNCFGLRRMALPDGITFLGSQYTFSSCESLSKLVLPDGLTKISELGVRRCYSLNSLTIPASVSSIDNQAFWECRGMKEMMFLPSNPPTISNSNAWTDFSTVCVIYVPFSALAAYLTATNYPNPATYTYIGFATYTSGAALPTQDSTEAYNVTWYATKADAIAETNSITVGNGKEIYCRYTAVT